MKILIAEDEATTALLLERALTGGNHEVDRVSNGVEALIALHKECYDIVITDWMMPLMDGVELIKKIRVEIDPTPIIFMSTAVDSAGSRDQAMSAGADEFFAKPLEVSKILSHIDDVRERQSQVASNSIRVPLAAVNAPFVAVGIAASTGGPLALRRFLEGLPSAHAASYLVTQHGPEWMLEALVSSIQLCTSLPVRLAHSGDRLAKGEIVVAPADQHLQVDAKSTTIVLSDGPKENFVRPSADPMLRSLAAAFGKKSVAVVLTGLGCDGANGAAHVAAAGGRVFIQSPEDCVAPFMPRSVNELGIRCEPLPIAQMAGGVQRVIAQLQ